MPGVDRATTKSSEEIAAVKARKPATTLSDNGFYFDPTEPLRLIDPGKQKPEK
jgi:hypothetical protein